VATTTRIVPVDDVEIWAERVDWRDVGRSTGGVSRSIPIARRRSSMTLPLSRCVRHRAGARGRFLDGGMMTQLLALRHPRRVRPLSLHERPCPAAQVASLLHQPLDLRLCRFRTRELEHLEVRLAPLTAPDDVVPL